MRRRVGATSVAVTAYLVLILLLYVTVAQGAQGPGAAAVVARTPWWMWALGLFVLTFAMGILAPMAGVGGGVLFVPIVSGFFPFHLDFVRSCGLLMAMCGGLAAGPGLLRMNLASLRLALPIALVTMPAAMVGSMLSLALPTQYVKTALGITILCVVVIMSLSRKSTFPRVRRADALSNALGIHGIYLEASMGQEVHWCVHRSIPGLLLFLVIGFIAGMFGMGAGWANVPALNLVMGVPLKVSVATSSFLLSITDSSAAWIYLHHGCVIPLIVVPSLLGIMLGSLLGVRLVRIARPASIRWLVIALLLFSGLKILTDGLGWRFIF